MTTSDLLDGAWRVIKCAPKTVFALSALLIIPVEVLGSFLVRGYGQALDLGTLILVFFPFFDSDSFGRSRNYSATAILAVAVLSLGYFYLGVAISKVMAGWYSGRDVGVREALVAAMRATPRIFTAFAVVLVPKVVAIMLLGVPAIFVFPLFLLVAPIIAFEDVGGWAAVRRSMRLVRRRYFAVLGIWLLSLVLERIVDLTLQTVPDLIANVTPAAVGDLVRPAGWAFALFITAPTVAGFAALVYLDLRVRTEGLDLELARIEAFDTALIQPVAQPLIQPMAQPVSGR